MKTIVVVRHPEKDGDKITAYGAQQAWAMALLLGTMFKFGRFICSGAYRTLQTLQVMTAALGLVLKEESYEVDPDFNFGKVLKETLGDHAAFQTEVAAMKEKNGNKPLTLTDALNHSVYANQGRFAVSKAIQRLAMDMQEGEAVLVVSHSPWLELAMCYTDTAPYGIGEADAVVYEVDGSGIIVSSRLIKGPLAGKTNT